MTAPDPLQECLLGLHAALGESVPVVRALAATHLDHPKAVEARRVVGEHFAAPDSLGILRLREHQLFFGRMDLNRFREELSAILPPLAT
jgi:hypothetical protein